MGASNELDALMRQHNMTARQIGVLVGREPKTVRNWRSSSDRQILVVVMELLRVKLAEGEVVGAAS